MPSDLEVQDEGKGMNEVFQWEKKTYLLSTFTWQTTGCHQIFFPILHGYLADQVTFPASLSSISSHVNQKFFTVACELNGMCKTSSLAYQEIVACNSFLIPLLLSQNPQSNFNQESKRVQRIVHDKEKGV